MPTGRPLHRWCVFALGVLAALISTARSANAQIPENRTLLVYNSLNAESLAVRNMYVLKHPSVIQFDLNNAAIAAAAAPGYGGISHASYVTNIRNPVRNFINGVTPPGPDRSQTIIAIATTRGLPARIDSGLGDEFTLASGFNSLEAELALLQQNMENAGAGTLPFRYSGTLDNPYHARLNQPITTFSRANIRTLRAFSPTAMAVGGQTWFVAGLTSGDIYLVCRVDAAPTMTATALENIQALLDRSQNLVIPRCAVQCAFDRCAGPNFLDDDGSPSTFPDRPDFPNAHAAMMAAGFPSLLDQSFTFIDGTTIPDQVRPVLALGSYGENHGACTGANPPGTGTYIDTFDFHPAACFVAFESFSGNSIVDGTQRGGQQQALDFISKGGSFTVANVAEPFTIWVADLEYLTQNLYVHRLSFAEAAYSAIPSLSWQQTPVGDPLARVTIIEQGVLDLNNDGVVNVLDVIQLSENGLDVTCDGTFTAADTNLMRDAARPGEPADVATPSP